jgi:hypothetical protein
MQSVVGIRIGKQQGIRLDRRSKQIDTGHRMLGAIIENQPIQMLSLHEKIIQPMTIRQIDFHPDGRNGDRHWPYTGGRCLVIEATEIVENLNRGNMASKIVGTA